MRHSHSETHTHTLTRAVQWWMGLSTITSCGVFSTIQRQDFFIWSTNRRKHLITNAVSEYKMLWSDRFANNVHVAKNSMKKGQSLTYTCSWQIVAVFNQKALNFTHKFIIGFTYISLQGLKTGPKFVWNIWIRRPRSQDCDGKQLWDLNQLDIFWRYAENDEWTPCEMQT